jgi:hypothetical protein
VHICLQDHGFLVLLDLLLPLREQRGVLRNFERGLAREQVQQELGDGLLLLLGSRLPLRQNGFLQGRRGRLVLMMCAYDLCIYAICGYDIILKEPTDYSSRRFDANWGVSFSFPLALGAMVIV